MRVFNPNGVGISFEMTGHRLVERLLLRKPLRQLRVSLQSPATPQQFADRSDPVRQTDRPEESNALLAHPLVRPPDSSFLSPALSANALRNCSFPREMRDMTVPIGISSVSAISL